jgi:hypothetical protein
LNQPNLFEKYAEKVTPPPIDPNVEPADEPRLVGQNAEILSRLRRGPMTNDELAEFSLKYTSRISDLRNAGHTIKAARQSGGTWLYTLQ